MRQRSGDELQTNIPLEPAKGFEPSTPTLATFDLDLLSFGPTTWILVVSPPRENVIDCDDSIKGRSAD